MYKLNNGVLIPNVGFGTWQMKDKEQCKNAVRVALETGYRHIDTAAIYGNEDAVGEGIAEFLKNSETKREDLFIVTKVWNTDQGYETTLKAFEISLEKLKLDYIDMYLVHWPQPKSLDRTWETWRALEELYKLGKVKAIGVCNMKEHHLKYIMENFEIVPVVNQIELHPHLQQVELKKFCDENGILVEAWSPLMQGALDHEGLKRVAQKNGRTVAQVVLKWHLQNGLLPLPKSVTPSRIKENFELNFELDKDDMDYINSLNKEERLGPDPDEITF
ncbi:MULTISPECIES: aldo/keto reductase [unclassified Cetobacterium]|uniref:aldo/keto reductase n=1 Tax=unclassified Cetobacterium TaxID=2630983 RepID=UPI0006480ED3|nr:MULTISPECIES: aldo/keto reductase [unclassified Cetobacterium]